MSWRASGHGRVAPGRRAAMTLVELIIAMALSVLLIGIVAAASIQSQKAMNSAWARTAVTSQVRAIFADLERDLGHLVPPAPEPRDPWKKDFYDNTVDGQQPLEIEAVSLNDANGNPRMFDKLRVFTSTVNPKSVSASGEPDPIHAVVEYAVDSTGTSGSPPKLTRPPGGGLETARLRRRVVKWAKVGSATAGAVESDSPVLIDDVIDFTVEYMNVHAGRPKFFAPGNGSTKNGAEFVRRATVNTDDFTVKATDTNGKMLLSNLRVGEELFLPTDPSVAGRLTRYVLRAQVGSSSQVTVNGIKYDVIDQVLVDEALPTLNGITATAYCPPPAIRVTIVVPFGRGPDHETARFTRVISVAR